MRQPPIDRRIMRHSIKGMPKSILGTDETMYAIDKVYIEMGLTFSFNPNGFQQTNAGNGCMGYDPKTSTPLPEGKFFAIGDTVEFVTAPIYPKKMTICGVTPFYDADGSIHHIGINLN